MLHREALIERAQSIHAEESGRFVEPPLRRAWSNRAETASMPENGQPPPTDEHLLARFAAGDRSALGELASRHENSLVGLATGLLDGRRDLAQDAVQEAWVRVIKYAHSFAGQSSFRTWMFRIVINRCRDVRAGLKTAPVGVPVQAVTEGPLRLVTGERDEDVRAALQRVAPSVRLLLLLCYHRGLTHPQAADVLGIPVGTLKSRLSAALAELRSEMKGTKGESEKRKAAAT
jgi:RNA polymerase sigma-70 factor (ECF subfamily)